MRGLICWVMIGVVVASVSPAAAFAQTACPDELKIVASDAAADDHFGEAVAIDGDTMVVGAPGDDDAGSFSGSAYIFRWNGMGWTEEAKLTAADAASGDEFGWSVALSGDTAIVGSRLDDDACVSDLRCNSGSAYVFTRSGSMWTQQAKLTAADGAANDRFGRSVAISGDSALVGAHFDGDAGDAGLLSGSAYIFTRSGSTWTPQTKLTASDAATNDFFGTSVSIDGDTAIVGASNDDDEGSGSGSAYIFTRSGSTWTEQAKLTAADAASGDEFGRSVSLSGDTALVGAWRDNDAGSASGSAYVFTRSGGVWTQQNKLNALDGAAGDFFGYSVSLSGDTALVGARRDDDACVSDPFCNSGSAYVFTRSGGVWTQQAKLTAADAAANDFFGISVAISGDTAIVGAYLDDDAAGANQGSVYFYEAPGGFVREFRDLNGDSKVNGSDLAILLSEWGAGGVADIDGDGITGGKDLAAMLAAWGPVCQ